MELRLTARSGRMGVYGTQDYSAGEIIVEEAPLLLHQPDVNRDNRKVQITNLEMQLPFRWIAQKHTEKHLSKLDMTYKVQMLPEDEFLQDMDSWSEEKTRQVYANFQRQCFVDVIYIQTQFPHISMQSVMKVANILTAYTLPITNPLSGHMMGVFVCSGKGMVSRIEHSCNPNCFYILENTQSDKLHVRVMAQRPIRAGEELTISYLGPNHAFTNWQERGAYLHQLLGFTCECALCKAEQSLLRNMPEDIRKQGTPVKRALPDADAVKPLLREEEEHRSSDALPDAQSERRKQRQQKKEAEAAEAEAKLHALKEEQQKKDTAISDVIETKKPQKKKSKKSAQSTLADIEPPLADPLSKRDFSVHESLRMVLAAGTVFRMHGYVTDPSAARLLPLSCETQLVTVLERDETRLRAVTLLRSLRQHLLRSDQTTDRVLLECWQLLRFLSDPEMMNARAHNKVAKRKKQLSTVVSVPDVIDGMPPELLSNAGLRLWPGMLLRFLELFLRSFLLHGFQRTSGANRQKLTWMITPRHLRTYLLRLVELQHEQYRKANRDLFPFQMRILIGALLTLLDQQLYPENFVPLPESPPQEAETKVQVADEVNEKVQENDKTDAAANIKAAVRARQRLERTYCQAQTLALMTHYYNKLNIPRRTSNLSLLLETANAHCFREWNKSFLMAACVYDAPAAFFEEVESGVSPTVATAE